MRYYIGVDGGGTKTEITLFNESKKMLDTVKVPGSNHENLKGSFQEAADIIMSGIQLLLESNQLTQADITEILMGLAGIDHPFKYILIITILTVGAIITENLSTAALLCATIFIMMFIGRISMKILGKLAGICLLAVTLFVCSIKFMMIFAWDFAKPR